MLDLNLVQKPESRCDLPTMLLSLVFSTVLFEPYAEWRDVLKAQAAATKTGFLLEASKNSAGSKSKNNKVGSKQHGPLDLFLDNHTGGILGTDSKTTVTSLRPSGAPAPPTFCSLIPLFRELDSSTMKKLRRVGEGLSRKLGELNLTQALNNLTFESATIAVAALSVEAITGTSNSSDCSSSTRSGIESQSQRIDLYRTALLFLTQKLVELHDEESEGPNTESNFDSPKDSIRQTWLPAATYGLREKILFLRKVRTEKRSQIRSVPLKLGRTKDVGGIVAPVSYPPMENNPWSAPLHC